MLDRRIAPPFNRNFSFHLLEPTTIRLGNGLEIHFVNGGKQDVIKVEFIFKAGRWYDPRWGTSYFTTQLLNKGTRDKNSFEIASLFDQLGAHIDMTSGVDFVTLSLYCLTRTLPDALNLLIDIVRYPGFPEKEIDQLKSQYLQNLKVNKEKTGFLASRLFRKAIFGPEHPYGKELEEEDVMALSRDDFSLFHQTFFKDFVVIVAGKIELLNQEMIMQALSQFSLEPVEDKGAIVTSNSHRYDRHQEKPGSLQVSLRAGRHAVPRWHDAYPRVFLVNHILGGYFGSRLMKNLREEKGLTYGIHSSLQTLKHDSYLVIGADVNKENRALAFDEIRKELTKIRTEKTSDEELDTARYHFIGSLQNEISTSFAHAEKIRNILLYDLKKDHYQRLIRVIGNLTPDDVMATADEYFHEDTFLEISAG